MEANNDQYNEIKKLGANGKKKLSKMEKQDIPSKNR